MVVRGICKIVGGVRGKLVMGYGIDEEAVLF